MDSLDHQILSYLRNDARLSVATLAKKLGVSRGTVCNRIARMERDHIILGYTVRVQADAQPQDINAWMSIAIEGHETSRIVRDLTGEPAVWALHDTNGRWDLLAELRVTSIAQLSDALERIRLIKGISATETSLHLKTRQLR
ncbi:MAG: Lrp/AsnC family transcriptional regulator [Castellaniella sp.]|uniref:Lrp/AsnC family transcriptional regulator n=1 Tax=Castellaniella sp. TaxID=1955812 RepID=UPI002AFE25D0|nr:Lrp/AsnC family transcriptional regulator [Castellaniella sp.]